MMSGHKVKTNIILLAKFKKIKINNKNLMQVKSIK